MNHRALAATFKIIGTFEDGGKLSDSFDFDETNFVTPYINVNIETSGGTFLGADYIDADGSLTFGDEFGFAVDSEFGEFGLTIDFDGMLTNSTTQLDLLSTSFEEDFFSEFGDARNLMSGSIEKVPEPLTIVGSFIALGMGTVFKNKKQQSLTRK